MSLLTLIQAAARRIGVPRPSVVASATDPTVLLLLGLAQQEGEELARYGDWRALRRDQKKRAQNARSRMRCVPLARSSSQIGSRSPLRPCA